MLHNDIFDFMRQSLTQRSSICVSSPGEGRGGGWKTLCIKIGYVEPGGAESREGLQP